MTLRDEIGVNETIVWQGKKDKRVSVFEAIFNPLLIFALVWFIFDMQFISSFLSYGGSFGTGVKSILVFFIIHLVQYLFPAYGGICIRSGVIVQISYAYG